MMQYEILDEQEPSNEDYLNFNRANICFVHPSTLQKLHISQFGYRKLISQQSDQIVAIFPNRDISEQILAISIELKATLKLHPLQKIKVQRTALKLHTDKYFGLPLFKIVDRIEFILIQNQLVELIQSPMISKLIKDPFYFKLGQEFRIKLSKLSPNFIKQLSPNIRRKWKKILSKNQEQFVRLFVEGVHYTLDKISYSRIWEGNNSQYYIFDPTLTTVHLEKNRFINRPNEVQLNLPAYLQKIYQLEPYNQLKISIDKIALSPTHVVALQKKKSLGVVNFFKYIAIQNKAYFYYLNCELQYTLNPITTFVEECYNKSPAIIFIDNIQWVYHLLSGNLQPKKNSFKFVQKLISIFKNNLFKKGDDYPLILVLAYTQNLYEMENLDAYHIKFKINKQQNQTINEIVLNEYKIDSQQKSQINEVAPYGFKHKYLSQEDIKAILQISKTVGFEILVSVLNKKQSSKEVLKEIENIIKTQKVAQIPKVNWDDIGGLDIAKDEIIQTILFPKMYPEIFDNLIRPRSGLLFYGPPGTGKTLLAKCIANECKMNFISVKGPEMLNMYIGESQKNVRQTFQRAFQAKPCIIFFDELDALIPKRGKSNDSGQVMDRIVAQLLSQMDNAWKVGDIFVIGATNRPDLLDPSIMRPGRFDKQIYLGICYQKQERVNILKAQTKKLKLHENVNFQNIVDELPINFTGADFYGLTSKALTISIQKLVEKIQTDFNPNEKDWNSHLQSYEKEGVIVSQEDLLEALKYIKPSVSLQELKKFQELKSKYS